MSHPKPTPPSFILLHDVSHFLFLLSITFPFLLSTEINFSLLYSGPLQHASLPVLWISLLLLIFPPVPS